MPEITRVAPHQYSSNDSYFLPQNLVSTNPFISGTSPLNKYDQGLREGLYQPYVRGANQPWYDQVGKAALRLVPSVAFKMGQGFAGTASLLGEVGKGITGQGFSWNEAFDSAFAQTWEEAEKGLEEALPIYGSQKYLEGNLADKVWTTSFWTQDAMDGIEFLASAYLPGSALSKVGSLTKLTNVGKMKNLSNALKSTKAFVGAKETSNLTGLVLGTMYNTTSEAMIEGKGVYDEIKKDLRHRFPTMSEEEIELKASKGARNTFAYNMAALIVPNFLQNKWMHGKSSFEDLRRLSNLGKVTDKELKANLLGSFSKGFASEGLWEENIQTAIAEYEKTMASHGKDELGGIGSRYVKGISAFFKAIPDIVSFNSLGTSAEAGSYEDQAATAVLLGGILGGPFSLMSDIRESKALREFKTQQDAKVKDVLLPYMTKAVNQLPDRVGSIHKTYGKNEDGTTQYANPEGKIEIDPNKLRLSAFNQFVDNKIQQQALLAATKGDSTHSERVTNDALSIFAWQLGQLSEIEDLNNEDLEYLIDTRLGTSPETLEINKESGKQLGLSNTVQTRKAEILQMVDMYKETKEALADINDFSQDKLNKQYKRDLHRALFYASSMNKHLNKISLGDISEAAKEQIAAMIEDNDNIIKQIKNSKNRKDLFEDYKKEIAPLLDLKEQESKVLREWQREKDPAVKKQLALEHDVLNYRMEELRAIEGSEEFKGELSNPDTQDQTFTSKMFGNRQALGELIHIPAKQLAQWSAGTKLMMEDTIEEDKLEEADPTTEEGFTKLNDLLSNYVASNRPLPESTLLDNIFKNIQAKRDLLDIEDFEEYLQDTLGIDPETLSDAEYDALMDKLERDKKKLDSLLSYKKQYDKAKGVFTELEKALLEGNEDYFKEKFLFNDYLAGVVDIVNKALLPDGTVNKEVVEEVDNVSKAINRVTVAKEVTKDNPSVQAILERYSEILEEVRLQLLDRAQHRAEQQVQAELQQTQALSNILLSPQLLALISNKYPTLREELQEAMADPRETRPFQLILKVLDDVKQDKELVALISKELEVYKEAVVIDIVENVELHPSHSGLPQNYFDRFKANPTAYSLSQVLLKIFPKVFTENPEYPFREFRNHLDLFSLEAKLDAHNWNYFEESEKDSIREEFKRIVGLYRSATEVQFVQEILQSKTSAKDLVEAESKMLTSKEFSPSFQQRSVILRLIHWFTTPSNSKNKSDYSTSISVRGIIGTGKTKAVLTNAVKLLMNLGLIKSDELILLGHSTSTTKQINQIIKGVESENTLDQYIDKPEQLDNVKLVVVDEAAAIPNVTLTRFVALAKSKGIKVILAGDASQNKADINPEFIVNQGIENTTPLSVAYRSNIASLTNAALTFKDRLGEVAELTVQSNKVSLLDLKDSTANALGVMAMNQADVVEILSKKSPRSRKLIVTNESQAQRLREQLPDVEVVDYLAVQGTEAEEIYIMIDKLLPSPLNQAMDTNMFNTAMYTSIGRGTKFVGLVLPGVEIEHIYTDTLADKADSLSEDFKIIELEHVDALNKLRELLGLTAIKAESLPSVQQATQTKEEGSPAVVDGHIPDTHDPTEDGISNNADNEQVGTIEGVKRVEVPSDEYMLMFPTNPMLPTKSDPKSHIDYSSVFIIKDPTEKDFLVVVKDKNYKKNKKVYPIAVLGADELDAAKSRVGKAIANNIGKTLSKPAKGYSSKNFDGFVVENIDSESIATFPVTDSTKKLTMTYSDRAPLKLGMLLKKFINQLFSGARGAEDLELTAELAKIFNKQGIDWTQAIKQGLVSIKVYNSDEAKKARSARFIPHVGVPYLVIEKVRWVSKNQKQEDPKPFHIELKPRKYNSQMQIPYMEEYLGYVKTFLSALEELKLLLPNSVIELNNIVKDGTVRREGTFAKMLDSYAKTIYTPSVDLSSGVHNLVKKQQPDIDGWVKSLGLPDLKTPEDVNKVTSQLDLIVPLVYGVKSGKKIITYKEYKQLLESEPSGNVGYFTPTNQILANKLTKFDKANPDASLEERTKAVGLDDSTRVHYTTKSGNLGEFSHEKDLTIVRGEGPIQNALNVLAAPNNHLSIHTQIQRKKENGQTSSYGGAKNLFSIERKSGQYYSEVRKFLTEEIGEKIFNRLFTPEAFSLVTSSPAWDLQQYFYGQTMFNGKEWNGKIELKKHNDGRVTFGIQDDNKVARPEAIMFVAQAIVDYVKNVTDQKAPNEFATVFPTVESAQQWYDALLDTVQAIEARFTDTTDVVTTQDLKQMVEQSPDQTFTNLYTPILKQGAKIAKHVRYAVSHFGKLDSKESRDIAEKLFETAFDSVTPTRIGIVVPNISQEVQQKIPSGKPPILSSKPVKVDPETIISQIENGDLSPEEALNKYPNLSKATVNQIKSMHGAYYAGLTTKAGAKKYKTTARKLLEQIKVTDPILKKLLDLISLQPGIEEVEIFEVQTWADKGIEMFAESEGDLLTHSVQSLEDNPNEFLHELIHVITASIFDRPVTELTQRELEFRQEIETIFELAKKSTDLSKVLTPSPSGITVKEFIANLSNPKFHAQLKKIQLPKKGKGITKILERIWEAIIKYFGGSTDLADATFASFENFIKNQFDNMEVQQEIPSLAEETFPELRVKLSKLGKSKAEIEEYVEAYSEEDAAGRTAMDKGINSQLVKKGISFAIPTINNLEEKEFFKKEC